MTDTTHTPGPWKAVRPRRGRGRWHIIPEGAAYPSAVVAQTCYQTNEEANAEHIVRCVNNHESLLAALETILFGVTDDVTNNNGVVDLVALEDTARQALASAKGEA